MVGAVPLASARMSSRTPTWRRTSSSCCSLLLHVVTSFKSNAELYNLKSIPFWIQSGSSRSTTLSCFKRPSRHLDEEQPVVAVVATTASVSSRSWPLQSGGLPFRAPALRDRHLHHVPGPAHLLFLPLSQVVVWLGLADWIAALMLIYPTFLVRSAPGFDGLLPHHPARGRGVRAGDGATRMQTLSKIVLPMAVPESSARALQLHPLLERVHYALTFISQSGHKTAWSRHVGPIRGDIYFWGSLMAGRCSRASRS